MNLQSVPIRPTPRISSHALQRCQEMGISTKVAKRIVQHPSMIYPAPPSYPPERRMVHSQKHPEFLVITGDENLTSVVTVLWRSEEILSREVANRMAREKVT